MARVHARTFSLASLFLPSEKRRAAYALYAFCRVIDDLVDRTTGQSVAGLTDEVTRYRRELDAALGGMPSGPVFRELAWAVRRFNVPPEPLYAVIAGVERDLVPVRYERWHALHAYCLGVASSVGEMCTYIFGVGGGAEQRRLALAHARTLGVAMQLTNILRDVGEDARRGRCYLPEDELAHFSIDREELFAAATCDRGLAPPLQRSWRWRGFMQFQMARALRLYSEAYAGVGLLSPDAQQCAAACALGYAGILRAIERRRFDTLTGRARLTAVERALVLWQSWRWTPTVLDPVGPTPRIAGHRPAELREPA